MKGSRRWMLALGVGVVLALVGWWGMPQVRPHVFHGMVIQSPQPASDFTLTAHTGERVRLSDFRGQVVLLFFGYTHCPDVCPATLAKVARALELLGPQAKHVRPVLISVDPQRDTPQRLAKYVTLFGPSFVGLTGTPEEIMAVATAFGIYYAKQEGTAASGYLVDHTATVTVVDPQGRVRLVFPFDTTAEEMAEDLAYLLR